MWADVYCQMKFAAVSYYCKGFWQLYIALKIQDWRNSQQWCWRFKSSGMWFFDIGQIIPDILKDHNEVSFRVEQSKSAWPCRRRYCNLLKEGNYLPNETVKQQRIPEYMNLHQGLVASWSFVHCLILWTELDSLQSSGGNVGRHLFVESIRRGKS